MPPMGGVLWDALKRIPALSARHVGSWKASSLESVCLLSLKMPIAGALRALMIRQRNARSAWAQESGEKTVRTAKLVTLLTSIAAAL